MRLFALSLLCSSTHVASWAALPAVLSQHHDLTHGLVRPVMTAPTTARAERVRVSHILVDSEALAKLAVAKLEERSVSFEELAESVSTCDSKARGGDLGWITPGLMVPEFDAAAFFFPPGEVVTAHSDFGWHVIRVSEAAYDPPEMEPIELRKRLECGDADGDAPLLQLIDLRDAEERAQAKVLRPGQDEEAPFRHLPYNSWMTWAEAAVDGTLDPPIARESEVLFMDHRGGRGERLMQYLAQQGYSRSRFLRGGINSYAEEADPRIPTYLESDGDCLTCHEH